VLEESGASVFMHVTASVGNHPPNCTALHPRRPMCIVFISCDFIEQNADLFLNQVFENYWVFGICPSYGILETIRQCFGNRRSFWSVVFSDF
jgi:hypothetical protein